MPFRDSQNPEAILARNITWPTLHGHVKSFCHSCPTCQRTEHASRPPQRLIRDILGVEVMDLLICDYCGPLRPPGPHQFQCVFSAVDFTKFVFSFPVKSCSAETTIKCLKEIFFERRLCRKLFYDGGTHYTTGSVTKFLSDLNIIQIQAPRYVHSSVGQVERCVGIIKTILTRYCGKESDWPYYHVKSMLIEATIPR